MGQNEPRSHVPPKRNLHYLESLRGLAALVVVLVHLTFAFFPTCLPLVEPLGTLSVRTFFLLSGFVLSISYFRRRERSVLAPAALKRYLRLMLPVCASILTAWALMEFGAFHNFEAAAAMGQPADAWLNTQLTNKLTFGQALLQGTFGTFFQFSMGTTLNLNLWTMSIELAGSVFVFAFLALHSVTPKRWLSYTITALVLLAVPRRMGLYGLDFFAGVALCDFFILREHDGRTMRLPGGAAFGLAALGLIISYNTVRWTFDNSAPHALQLGEISTLGGILLVGAASFCSPLRGFLEHSVMAFLGRISFPLYLFHDAVICSLGCGSYLKLREFHLSHLAAGLLATGTSLVVSILVAWLAYYLVERPAIQISAQFAKLCLGLFSPRPKMPAQDPMTIVPSVLEKLDC